MEFFGTFSLIFMGSISILASSSSSSDTKPEIVHAGLAYGSILGIMVYIGLLVSGAHFNPALTLAFAATRNIDPVAATLYIIA